MLDYEKLDMYQVSIQFLALAIKIIDKLPKGNATIGDQFKRASLSVPLNIAEGTGKNTKADKQRFYTIARGSAMECGAVLDVCKILKIIEPLEYDQVKKLLIRIVGMLTKMSNF